LDQRRISEIVLVIAGNRVKFLHTADWQIGMKAAHVGEAGDRVRAERLHAVGRVVEAADREKVDFVVVAGDIFEDKGVDRALVRSVVDRLASCTAPVYLIPGNHDPLTPGSVWEHPAWSAFETIHLLQEEKPVAVPGGTLLACPVRARHSREDPTGWLRDRADPGIRVALAHGSVQGLARDEPDHPIARDAWALAGVDYMALGHWHSFATFPAADGTVRMAYSGTPEPTRFGERDSGNVLVVEISEPRARPTVTKIPTNALCWATIEEELRQRGDLARLRATIEGRPDADTTLLELQVAGVLPAEDREEMARIAEIVDSRFLFGRIEASGLQPSPDDETWLADLPAGILREAGFRLRDLADPGFAGKRPAGAEPEVAARALLEFYALVGEARS
jgi:DNA repair exonuclease SbcCD nuclease subunit